MTGLTFVDELPGHPGGRRSRSLEIAAELRSHPGKWAQWPSKTAVTGVKKTLTAIGPGFEVVGRTVDGRVQAFARYAGQPMQSGQPVQQPAAAKPKPGSATVVVICKACGNQVPCEPPGSPTQRAEALAAHRKVSKTCDAIYSRQSR